METREATPEDAETIREVARASLRASYSLSPGAIDEAVEKWYDDDAVPEKIDAEDDLLLVVEEDGEVVAFSESVRFEDRGEVRWLHVAPPHRGRGIGAELFERTAEALEARGADLVRGRVLQDNAEGNEFYGDQGMTKVEEGQVEIGGRTYIENVYVEEPVDSGELLAIAGDGRELFVDRADAERGSLAPFYAVYSDPDGEDRYGYFCGNCERLANAMDSMGRIECENCGNTRKPTRWDAAYL